MPRARGSKTAPPPVVSIVILCHNDGKYLKGCLASLRRHTDKRKTPYELILVNNASQDGSGPFLRRLARSSKDVRLIENAENRFFAGGNNQGMRAARGRFVLLLNADTIVGPQWLERLMACAERDPLAGAVGPYTNGAVGYQLVGDAKYDLADFARFCLAWSLGHDGRARDVHRLIGFCLLIKGEVMKRVGLLDERFGPGGYEDYDYCARVRQAGYKVLLAEDVFVHHFGGKGYVGMDYDGLRRRNRELLADKWCRHIVEVLDDIDAALAN